MGGYELAVSLAIFRGGHREGFATARPIEPGKALPCDFAPPNANHEFQPWHRVMVQMQSTLFPLYDRNPQIFAPSIFLAKPSDCRKATQRIWRTPHLPSHIELPVR